MPSHTPFILSLKGNGKEKATLDTATGKKEMEWHDLELELDEV
jgi:hypothetical protein